MDGNQLGFELRHRGQHGELHGAFGLLGHFQAVVQVLHEKGQPQPAKNKTNKTCLFATQKEVEDFP